MSWPNSERSGAPLNVPVIFFASTSTHDGKPTFSASCSASWMRSCALGLVGGGDDVAGACSSADGTFSDLAVDGDRAVRHELPRFGARRAEAHPVDDVVEPRLEQLQQVRAGRALAAASPRGNNGGTGARARRRCGAASASRAADGRSPTCAHARLARRAARAWCRACTSSRANAARSSGKGPCLPVAPACIWVRCISSHLFRFRRSPRSHAIRESTF